MLIVGGPIGIYERNTEIVGAGPFAVHRCHFHRALP